MSSQIQISTTLKHAATGLTVQSARTYTASENEAAFIPTEVTTTPESIDYGNIVSVKAVAVKVTGGDDVLVSLDGGDPSGTWPLRVELNGGVVLPINSDGLVEISTVQATADVNGNKAGTYFDLTDRNGTVRVWLDMPARAEVSQIVVNTATGINSKYFDIYDDTGPVRVWIDEDSTGTAPTTPGGGRLLEVDVAASPTVADITNAIQAKLEADSKFSATDDNTDTITVTDASGGTRTDISEPDTATYFSVSTTTQGVDAPSAPATPGGGRLVEAAIAADDTAATIASAINTAFASDAEITATVADDTVTLTDKHTGTRTDITDTGSTGFTLATTQQGAAIPDIKIKSVGTSQVSTGAVPK